MNPEHYEHEEVEEHPHRKGRWVAWLVAMVVVGGLVGGIIVGIIAFVNGPVSATAIEDPVEKARQSIAPTPATNLLAGKDIELSYPSNYSQVVEHGSGADQWNIATPGGGGSTIAVAVPTFKEGDVIEDPSYRYRSIHPELYKPTTQKIIGETVYFMTKTDNTEVTLFWVHKGKELTISITSMDPHFNVTAIMAQILPTVRWKT